MAFRGSLGPFRRANPHFDDLHLVGDAQLLEARRWKRVGNEDIDLLEVTDTYGRGALEFQPVGDEDDLPSVLDMALDTRTSR